MLKRQAAALLCLTAMSCGEPLPADSPDPSTKSAPPTHPAQSGPLPPKQRPADAAPAADGNAQAAAEVLRSYFALIGERRYGDAWALRWHGKGDDGQSAQAFARSFERYAEYRVNIGTPGPVSNADNSSFVDIPVQIYGRLKSGGPFSSAGTVTMRRLGPGASAAERRWRVYARD